MSVYNHLRNQHSPSADSVARSAAAAPAPTDDPEKIELIQQQTILLFHAKQCQRQEKQSNDVVGQCSLPYCKTLKFVLSHMKRCSARKSCPVPYCSSSREIISHRKNCTSSNCPVCVPLKQALERQKQAAATVQKNQSSQGLAPADMKTADAALELPFSAENVKDQAPQCSRQNSNQIKTGNVALINAPPIVPRSSPHNSSTVKDWHRYVNKNFQLSMVRKIILAIFPTTGITTGIPTVPDTRMINLVSYAREIEEDTYSAANSREEYYEMIAQKLYKILKEHREKRQEKEEMQLQQAQQVGAGLGPMIENNSGASSPCKQ